MTKRGRRERARWHLAQAVWALSGSDVPARLARKAGEDLAEWWDRLSPVKRKSR